MDETNEFDGFNFVELPYGNFSKQPPIVVFTRRSKKDLLKDISLVIGLSDPNPWVDVAPIEQGVE